MLKTVADALSTFRDAAISDPEAANHAKAIYVREMVDFLQHDTLNVVQVTLPISTAYDRLKDAARIYSAGDPRHVDMMIARRHALKVALHNFARVLDGAQASEAAMIIATVNPTEVPNPITGPL